MANPWNSAAFPKEEDKLSDIMSEEFSERLRIEDDFVWLDVPEVQQVTNIWALTKSDSVLSDSDITPVTNIVQSEMECKTFEFEETDKTYDYEHSSINQLDDDAELYELCNWKRKNDNKKLVNMVKCTTQQHRTYINRQADLSIVAHRNNSKKQRNKETSFLPPIDFGKRTNALLKSMIDRHYVGRYTHVVGTGKNSVVFHAPYHRHTCISITCINVVKVYKLSNNENENKAVYKRVQREFEHLNIVCNKLGNCPVPYRAWDNLILMSFAGRDEKSTGPTIKDVTPTKAMYWTIVRYIDKLYNELHLVHGKLRAKNIRCYDSGLHFIGWGHSVRRDHPLALPKLIKDCHYITKFYTQRGFKVPTTEDRFKKITGYTKINSNLLDVINKMDLYEKYDENPNRRYHTSIKPKGNLRFKNNKN